MARSAVLMIGHRLQICAYARRKGSSQSNGVNERDGSLGVFGQLFSREHRDNGQGDRHSGYRGYSAGRRIVLFYHFPFFLARTFLLVSAHFHLFNLHFFDGVFVILP